MSELSEKQTLLDLMELHRAAWDDTISRFSRNRLLESGVESDWSVKDVIAHVAAYEDWTAEQMEASHRGVVVSEQDLQAMGAEGWYDVDNRNRRLHEQMQDKPLDEVLVLSEQAFNRLLEAVESLSDEELQTPQWWSVGKPLVTAIPAQSFEHYAQHIDALKAWLAADTNAA